MYIVKWLAGHPILATWALGAIAILLSMGNHGGAKKHEIESRHITTEHAITETETDSKKVAVEEKSKEAVAEKVTGEATKEAVVVEEVAVTESAKPVEEAKVMMAAKDALTENKVDGPFTPKIPGDSELAPPSKATSAAISDLGQSNTQAMLQMAREAYWNNGLDESVQIYQKLIELEPNVVEHKGELGNVYWRQGYPKKAAELYSDIAVPLIESGSSERVMNMVGFIQLFYPDRVEVILERMELQKQQ